MQNNIKIGDSVSVTDPKHPDSAHDCGFSGSVIGFTASGAVKVEDQNGDVWTIEPDEIEEED